MSNFLKEDSSLYENTDVDWVLTIPMLILLIILTILVIREMWQMFRYRKRYFYNMENYLEWAIILLAVVNVLPRKWIEDSTAEGFQRHVAALTLLLAFMQLYLLLVRVVPNTPIPIYINMFTTVLKTYTFILMSYLAFIVSFAYSFYLILGDSSNDIKCTEDAENCDFFDKY